MQGTRAVFPINATAELYQEGAYSLARALQVCGMFFKKKILTMLSPVHVPPYRPICLPLETGWLLVGLLPLALWPGERRTPVLISAHASAGRSCPFSPRVIYVVCGWLRNTGLTAD